MKLILSQLKKTEPAENAEKSVNVTEVSVSTCEDFVFDIEKCTV